MRILNQNYLHKCIKAVSKTTVQLSKLAGCKVFKFNMLKKNFYFRIDLNSFLLEDSSYYFLNFFSHFFNILEQISIE